VMKQAEMMADGLVGWWGNTTPPPKALSLG
jgi:hypothetical protein